MNDVILFSRLFSFLIYELSNGSFESPNLFLLTLDLGLISISQIVLLSLKTKAAHTNELQHICNVIDELLQ